MVTQEATQTWFHFAWKAALASLLLWVATTPIQGQGRRPSAHNFLTSALESYRRGEYETAATHFQQTQARQQELTPLERQDLIKGIELNNGALQARQDGAARLAQAEELYNTGRLAEAAALYKDVASNQFLSAADRQHAMKLGEKLKGKTESRWSKLWPGSKKPPNLDPVPTVVTKMDAKSLLQAGREALAKGDLDSAEALGKESEKQAKFLDFAMRADSPTKLLKDCQEARTKLAKSNPGPMVPVLPKNAVALKQQPPETSADAKTLVKQAREFCTAGKLDEARERALMAQSIPGTKWNFFDDTPDRVLDDVHKARQKRNQQIAETELAEARKLFNQGDFEGAKAKAYKAQSLHPSYNFWDLGDRPQKLLNEIQEAEAKRQKGSAPLPPAPVVPPALAKNPPSKPAPEKEPVQPVSSKPMGAGTSDPPPALEAPPLPKPQEPLTGDAAAQRAGQLMAEAKSLRAKAQILEARQKVLEAQKLGVVVTDQEERPEVFLAGLKKDAEGQINLLLQEAKKNLSAKSDSHAAANAEACLTLAQDIAKDFGFNTSAIDAQLNQVQKMQVPGPRGMK